jgi:ATP-binding cassette, subfamily B, bacterial
VIETLTLQAGPLLTATAIDDGVRTGNADIVFLMGAWFVGAILVNGLATWARISWTGRLGQRLMKQLRLRVFSHIQRLSLDFFTEEKAGRIMTRMTSDIEALSELLQDGIINLAVQAFTLLFVVAVMFRLNVQLAIVVLVGVVPVMTAMTLWFRLRSEQTYGRVRERIADVLADLQESLSGVRIVTAYNRQRYNTSRHIDIIGEHYDANVEATRVAAVYGPGTELVGTFGQGLILLVGGWMVLDQRLSVGELTAFVLYLSSFFAPIQQLVQLYNTYQSGQAAVTKLRDLLGTEPSVSEAPPSRARSGSRA